MAFERILAKFPRTAVPDDAQCFICLDGGDVFRRCVRRGPSAGFAHVDCLAEMAARDEWIIVTGRGGLSRWSECVTCQQSFTGALGIEMSRRQWRRCRDARDPYDKSRALQVAVSVLKFHHEVDATDGLDDESTGLPRDEHDVIIHKMGRAHDLVDTNPAAAVDILMGLRARIWRCGHVCIRAAYALSTGCILHKLGRFREALAFAAESVELTALWDGPESSDTLAARCLHGKVLADLVRVQEGRTELSRVLAAQTRVLGADHYNTRKTTAILNRMLATDAS